MVRQPKPRVDATILIVAGGNDLHALAVKRELEVMGRPALFLACDKLRDYRLNDDLRGHASVTIDSQELRVSDLKTIWWRRPSLNQRLPDCDNYRADELDFINRNSTATLKSMLLAEFRGRWVSSPVETERAADKMYQLRLARQHGFRVPETLVSNDPRAVRAFHDAHLGGVIIKAARSSGQIFLATERFDIASTDDRQIELVPSVYQELIPGTRHLRINCFGKALHTALIETEDLDWRPNLNVPISAYELEDNLKDRITSLLEAFKLETGIMDVKLTDDGEPVWFEINPQGQFLFLEPLTGQPLLSSFARFLAES